MNKWTLADWRDVLQILTMVVTLPVLLAGLTPMVIRVCQIHTILEKHAARWAREWEKVE